MKNSNLYQWGLSKSFEQQAEAYIPFVLARVTEQHRTLYKVICENGFLQASVSGKFAHKACDPADYPAVGDWVMVECLDDLAVIHHLLSRKSAFKRKAVGTPGKDQIVAANIDMVFICMALNEDYNLRRLERYLSIAWDSGAVPAVLLTKSDLCENLDQRLTEVSEVAFGTDIIVCTQLKEDGYDAVLPHIQPGKTIAFIGSSGVGKSTLINHLTGEDKLVTRSVRDDGKGRHATTYRQLILLPGGGLVMDTPGMREIGVTGADLETSFSDIEELAEQCRFHDCSHASEPGCAIQSAIENGFLDVARFENYQKIQTEHLYSGLSSKQIEEEKINRMFGGKNEMKQMMRSIKQKNR